MSWRVRRRSLSLLLLAAPLSLLAAAQPASATLIALEWTGEVASTTTGLEHLLPVGAHLSGRVLFDPGAPGELVNAVTEYTRYPAVRVTIRAFETGFSDVCPGGRISINDASGAFLTTDFFFAGGGACSTQVGERGFSGPVVVLNDTTGTAIANELLPTEAPDLAQFDLAQITMTFALPCTPTPDGPCFSDLRPWIVTADLTGLRAVDEPAPAALAIAAAGALVRGRRLARPRRAVGPAA